MNTCRQKMDYFLVVSLGRAGLFLGITNSRKFLQHNNDEYSLGHAKRASNGRQRWKLRRCQPTWMEGIRQNGGVYNLTAPLKSQQNGEGGQPGQSLRDGKGMGCI